MVPGRTTASARPLPARDPSPGGPETPGPETPGTETPGTETPGTEISGTGTSGGRSADRRTILVIAAIQVAIGLGFYAVFGHVVAHMRDGVGLAAGTIGLVLGTRLLIQYTLLLPVGALTDALGAPRAGTLACVVRAGGFGLLGTADGIAGLVSAAVLLGVGGALYHPAAQSLVAGLSPARRPGGYATYLISGHISAVIGPPAGLVLLAGGGFPVLAAAAAAAWGVAAALFLLLPPAPRAPGASAPRTLTRSLGEVGRDRRFLRFAVAVAPSTLLASTTTTVVPLKGFDSGWATVFFCVAAAVIAAVQPWCATGGRAGRPRVLRAGLLLSGTGYLALVPLDGSQLTGGGDAAQVAGLLAAAVLSGLGAGLLQPSIFQVVARHAPPGRVGAYLGTSSFLAGMMAFAGGLAVGALFDAGPAGAATALTGLGVLALLSAVRLSRTADGAVTPSPVRGPSGTSRRWARRLRRRCRRPRR
ncbi:MULTISPECIES: MFS transporter [unclassified Spirillospora]|uniref:MFS transporter n=1 Tax=unclassified Spirillospora TaxID=2642701 RepID=UPI0037110719